MNQSSKSIDELTTVLGNTRVVTNLLRTAADDTEVLSAGVERFGVSVEARERMEAIMALLGMAAMGMDALLAEQGLESQGVDDD